jgi:predicted ATP-grasp superfamily ATP-dependent carboligase
VSIARTTALVLDAHLKSSLATIRSLGNHGVPIIAGSHRRAGMGLYSRHVRSRFVYPSPLEDRRGFVDAVIAQATKAGKIILFAFGDSTLEPLIRDGLFDRQGSYVAPSNREFFDIAFDKARTLKLARRIGLEIPRTYFCARESDLRAVLRELTYPAVVKPRRSASWNGNAGTQNTTMFAFSAEDVTNKCAELVSRTGEFPLVQEYIQGEEAGVEFLCDDGRVLAACAHRRIRSTTPAGGSGVVNQTIPLSYGNLGARAKRLVAELRWSGPIMVEFKFDREQGIPKLMEANGRFWGSLPLAIAAGVDFPYLYYKLACGERPAPSLDYAKGIISRHFLGDMRNLMWVLFENDPMRDLAFPGRLQAVKDFLAPPRPSKSDVLDWRDMKPAMVEFLDAASRRLSRRTPVSNSNRTLLTEPTVSETESATLLPK